MIAATLIIEKINSPSPYPLTPNILMTIISKRNIVTKIAWLYFTLGSQKLMVIEAEITSSGKIHSHCKA
jgi:hypothetical protein